MKTVLVDIDTQRQRYFLECGDPATVGPLSKPRTCPRTPRRVRIKDRRTLATFFVISLALPFGAFAQENPAVAPRALPVAAGPNDVARFLAGMPVPENSPLSPLTRDPAWQQHAAFFEEQFTKLNVRQLQKLHAWQETYLPESVQQIPVAFYMFSGPDFLYVDQFFPKAAVYVLCGKESLGPPPDPLRIANLSGALGNLENAMKSSLNTTYFITKDMKVDLHEQNLNGVLPILYAFIARADKSITNVTLGSLSSSGAFQEGAHGTSGVRIRYTDSQSGDSQTMYYFTTDISDGGIKSTPGFLKFCQRLGVGSSFLKSCSYLMFENGFGTIRNFILDHSRLVVQDDSGIPIANLDPNKWNVRLFGVYLGPIELFKQHYQPRLRELFAQSNPPPLEFGFGYQWNYKEANLIVAERK
ncbi:MAG: hypothetical protein DME80_00980 [Verrucomicrobia bacterium]|nr:MAG: hypothetical protein DME89_00165 [Verrucomicrobiota bacterium]PYJ45873.1 MAG: hypothetical protein DME80_00980 [Verrucomicrobiota bacterium]